VELLSIVGTDLACPFNSEQWYTTFRTNIDSYFHITKAALRHMSPGASIINSTSVDAYIGVPTRVDYAASKGAVVAFTRALSNQLVKRGIRVNAVAAGPTWTPMLAATTSGGGAGGEEGGKGGGGAGVHHRLGYHTPMDRLGQPAEVATSYVFLASGDAAFMSGQTMHPNGGIVVNG
jgi:NAD(P)-dependent dehydrogenase (short-subunit alcohol dehydrogenase family)